MAGPGLGELQDPAVVAPIPSAATFSQGGTEQRHPRRGVLSLHCAASANRREMGFPAAGERGLNNKWQQWELGWRTLALEKQAEKMVAWSVCRES